jgi:hypothetical protein
VNDWNTLAARVIGNPPEITTWINGNRVTSYHSDKKFEHVLGNRGSLALQVHGGKSFPKGRQVRYRNIRIKEF